MKRFRKKTEKQIKSGKPTNKSAKTDDIYSPKTNVKPHGPKRKLRFSKISILIIPLVVAIIGGGYYLYKSFAATPTYTTIVVTLKDAQTGGLIGGGNVSGSTFNIGLMSNAGDKSACNLTSKNPTNWAFSCKVHTYTAGVVYSSYRVWYASAPGYQTFNDPNGSSGYFAVSTGGTYYPITFLSPPPSSSPPSNPPSVQAPAQPRVTVTPGRTSLKFSWGAVSGATNYKLYISGPGIKGKIVKSLGKVTSYTQGGLKCSSKYSYDIAAENSGGSSGSRTLTASTSKCSPSPPPTTTPPTSHRTQTVTVYRTMARPQPAQPANPDDTKPPTTPTNLKAEEDSMGVQLSWDESTDNKGVKCYSIERQESGGDWQMLSDCETGTSYTDSTKASDTKYTYRVSALDEAGNGSDYAVIDITTSDFQPNAFANQENTIESEDGTVSVKIPAGALPEDAFCMIDKTSDSTPSGQNLIAGVYSLVCKKKDGSTIDQYNSQLESTVKAGDKSTSLYFKDSDNWQDSGEKYNGDVQGYSFSTDSPKPFAVLAGKKGANWIWIVLLLFLLLLIIAALVIWLVKRRQSGDDNLDDSYDLGYFDPNNPQQNQGPQDTSNYYQPDQSQAYGQPEFSADPSANYTPDQYTSTTDPVQSQQPSTGADTPVQAQDAYQAPVDTSMAPPAYAPETPSTDFQQSASEQLSAQVPASEASYQPAGESQAQDSATYASNSDEILPR